MTHRMAIRHPFMRTSDRCLELTRFGGRFLVWLSNRFGGCLGMHIGIFDNVKQGFVAPFKVQG